MKLIIGLGNPGEKYENTPHNAGFFAVDKFRDTVGYISAYDVSDWEYDKYLEASVSYVKVGNKVEFVFAKPYTYMNESGRSVNALIKRFNVKINEDVVLFHDDLDLKLGTYKVVRGKFPKAHNGLLSIFNITQNSDYLFVRLGIENREDPRFPGEDFVLKKFTESELTILTEEVLGAIKDVRPYISI